MAHSETKKKRAAEYLEAGFTDQTTAEALDCSRSTIQRWKKQSSFNKYRAEACRIVDRDAFALARRIILNNLGMFDNPELQLKAARIVYAHPVATSAWADHDENKDAALREAVDRINDMHVALTEDDEPAPACSAEGN